jgi:cobalamin synthase
VFLILLKWQLYVRALSFLGDITFPLVICCLGRWSMVVGAVKVRCADDGHSPALGGAARLRDVLIAAAAPVAVAVLLHRSMAAALLMVSIVIPVLVRLCARNRGGVTTDVAGSVNEFVEVAALALLLFQPLILPFLH